MHVVRSFSSQHEEAEVQRLVMDWLMPDSDAAPRFPGSQPVSLARSNLHLLTEQQRNYRVRPPGLITRFETAESRIHQCSARTIN